MLTLNYKTGAVEGKREHDPVIVQTAFGRMDQTPGYIRGWLPPRYAVPAISHTDPTMRAVVDLSQWYSNGDYWWGNIPAI